MHVAYQLLRLSRDKLDPWGPYTACMERLRPVGFSPAIIRAEQRIRESGGRLTASRRRILEILEQQREHVTAEGLVQLLQGGTPSIHRSTIYRALEEFERYGIVVHTHVGHGAVEYHLGTEPGHAHAVCERCGTVLDLDEAKFEDLGAELLSSCGFQLHPGHVALVGLCAACAEDNASRTE